MQLICPYWVAKVLHTHNQMFERINGRVIRDAHLHEPRYIGAEWLK